MNNPTLTMLSAQGAPVPAPTTSLDLPPALASILSVGTPAAPPSGMAPAGGLSGSMTNNTSFLPQYEEGGMIGQGGMPMPPAMPMGGAGGTPQSTSVGVNPNMQQGGAMNPQMMDMQVNQFASQHPEQVQQIRAAIMEVMQTGELTPEELNTVIQLATVAAQNPEMYPYIRKFAIQQGIATDQDLPQQYDQGLVFVLLLAARAVQQAAGGQNMMQGGTPAMAGNPSIPSMAVGGPVPNSKKASGGVIIEAHEGEYVIPKRVVEMKGREFFDSLVEKYKES